MNISINKRKVAQRFAQAQQNYDQHAWVQQKICQQLSKLIHCYLPHQSFDSVLDIGCGTGQLTQLLMQKLEMDQIYLNDLYPEIQSNFEENENAHFLIGDIETVALNKVFDLVVSSSALQWVRDLEQVIQKIKHHLKMDNLFCFSTFGTQNLEEMKQLTGCGLDYFNIIELRQILEKHGFEILYLAEDLEKIYFKHPKQVLEHLKATGVTATEERFRWTKTTLNQFYEGYEAFAMERQVYMRYPLTYHPIYCIARKVL